MLTKYKDVLVIKATIENLDKIAQFIKENRNYRVIENSEILLLKAE